MNDDPTPEEADFDWASRLGWLVAGAYGIGLLSRKVAESRLQYPIAASTGLFDSVYLTYGALFIAFSIVARLGVLAMLARQPWKEALIWWQKIADRTDDALPTGITKRFWLLCRWASTIVTYIAPYFIVIWMIAGIATGWTLRATLLLGLYFSAVPVIEWLRAHLERSGKVAEEKDLVTPHLAALVGLSKKHAQHFQLQYFVLVLAIIAGVVFFNTVPLSLGGGRPTRVLISLTSEADSLTTSPLRGISEQPVWLLPSSDSFFVIRRSSDASQPSIFVPHRFVAAVTSAPR
jgi:hypothetical protein